MIEFSRYDGDDLMIIKDENIIGYVSMKTLIIVHLSAYGKMADEPLLRTVPHLCRKCTWVLKFAEDLIFCEKCEIIYDTKFLAETIC
jgi:hypothetical protein